MGKLYDIKWKKTDKGTIEICGKMDKGDYTVAGCIEVAVDDRGIPISIGGNVKDEDIAQALREWARKNIRIK